MSFRCNSDERALNHPAGAEVAGGGPAWIPAPRRGSEPNPSLVSRAGGRLAAQSSRLFVKKL